MTLSHLNEVVDAVEELLPGVTMQIPGRRFRALGIAQQTRDVRPDELGEHLSAAVMNSWTPGIPIVRIGDSLLGQEAEFMRLLHSAYRDEPFESV